MRKKQDPDDKKLESVIDKYIGTRIRVRRNLLGLTQFEMARILNISFQQVQKYEAGKNHMSSSRFWQFSRFLNVPVGYFFDGIELYLNAQGIEAVQYAQDCFFDSDEYHILSKPYDKHSELRELVDSYSQIKNPSVAESVLNMIKTMANADMEQTELNQEENFSEKRKKGSK